MKCEDYQELISLYVDDVLIASEKQQLEDHLKHCLSCKETLETLLMMKSVMSEIEQVEVPEIFHKELHMRLRKEESGNKKTLHKWMPYVSGIVAALIIGVVFIGGLDKKTPIMQGAPMAYGLGEENLNEASVDQGLRAASFSANTREIVQEEIWQIESTNLEATMQFLDEYAKIHEASLVYWQTDNLYHYVLDPVEDKNMFKSSMENEMWLKGDIQITTNDMPVVHLIINIQEK